MLLEPQPRDDAPSSGTDGSTDNDFMIEIDGLADGDSTIGTVGRIGELLLIAAPIQPQN